MDLLKVPVWVRVLVAGRPLRPQMTHVTKHTTYVCEELSVIFP